MLMVEVGRWEVRMIGRKEVGVKAVRENDVKSFFILIMEVSWEWVGGIEGGEERKTIKSFYR